MPKTAVKRHTAEPVKVFKSPMFAFVMLSKETNIELCKEKIDVAASAKEICRNVAITGEFCFFDLKRFTAAKPAFTKVYVATAIITCL